MTLKLRYVPDSILKEISIPIETIDNTLLNILDNMLRIMYEKNGIGLAGVQAGFPKRVVVLDVRDKNTNSEDEKKKRNPRFLINPEIIESSENKIATEEGCLSVPEQRAIIERPEKIKIKFLDKTGKEQILEADGILARCIQHEIDHLNGILFTDHLSKLKKNYLISKALKVKKRENLE
jgi:peptide deformylase